MDDQRKTKSARFWIIIAVVVLVAASAIEYWDLTRVHIYRRAVSPDGTWSVTVHRQWVRPPLEEVDVIVSVQDSGNEAFRQRISEEDIWDDVERKYPVVTIDEKTIRIGPDYWGQNEYFELSRTELERGEEVPTCLNSSWDRENHCIRRVIRRAK